MYIICEIKMTEDISDEELKFHCVKVVQIVDTSYDKKIDEKEVAGTYSFIFLSGSNYTKNYGVYTEDEFYDLPRK